MSRGIERCCCVDVCYLRANPAMGVQSRQDKGAESIDLTRCLRTDDDRAGKEDAGASAGAAVYAVVVVL